MSLTAVLSTLTLLALQAAALETLYFEIDGNLMLDPKYSGPIDAITWKHKGNIVAEYIKDAVPLEYLGDFKGRAALNLTTGILTLSNMIKSDDGVFTVEINNRVLPVNFTGVGIRKLSSVEVIARPLTCNSDAHSCTLSCGIDFTDHGPVQYFWKKGEAGEWKEDQKTITIVNEEEKNLGYRPFTCKAKNLFNEKESNLAVNPFKNNGSSGPLNAGQVAGIVIGLIIVIGLLVAGGWLYYKKFIKKDQASAPAGEAKPTGIRFEAVNMSEPGKDS